VRRRYNLVGTITFYISMKRNRQEHPTSCPRSTYRLQLRAEFTLDDAAAITEYLDALNISHMYASPILQAAPGSSHGYDVVDFRSINRELGGEEGFERLHGALENHDLGLVVDIVPNHMSLSPANCYWWDVLENGPRSHYARYFDVAWDEGEASLRDKVLVPILAGQYGRMLNDGQLKVVRENLRFKVAYHDHRLPIAPETIGWILTSAAERSGSDALVFLAHSFKSLMVPDRDDVEGMEARHRDKTVLFGMLDRLCDENAAACNGIDEAVQALNDDHEKLDEFLNAQNYRLSWWHTAQENLDYRRFFDVNTLVGVKVGEESVFRDTHALIRDWVEKGLVDGLRIDHPDGLRDPKVYFERLRAIAPHAWIVVEKILGRQEVLPEQWPVAGTSGYEFIRQMNGLLISPSGLDELERIYSAFTGQTASFEQLCHDNKMEIARTTLGSDVNYLTEVFAQICESHREYRDYTRGEVRRAIREVAAWFPLYRTYVASERDEVSEVDIACVDKAVELAKSSPTDVEGDLFDFLRNVLLLRVKDSSRESEFINRFQQFSSAIMAKGVEDTTFYQFNRLVSLNEVGCDPGVPVVSVEEFHRASERAQQVQPERMVTLTTHDTKRSEDVRARLSVLSEEPSTFGKAIRRWSEMTKAYRSPLVDRNTEYFYYQTVIGAWPLTEERALAYMEKATREAKQQTTWVQPNKEFDEGLRTFIQATLKDDAFVADIERFVNTIREAGYANSLTQTLLKCTVPGVPDLYQGSELWDLRLVDPDNRTPVDYELRRRLLAELPSLSPQQMMQRMSEGLPKLWLIQKALEVRKKFPEAFGKEGSYVPMTAEGAHADRCVSFSRGDRVIVIAQRLPLTAEWTKTSITLPAGSWQNILTGTVHAEGKHKMARVLPTFPVALLVRED
jgi:(1->4)-alpha-D-glucan 1-alpha-D-glucosylmutase